MTVSTNTKRAQRRTNTENAVPIIPANTENIKYNVPISLAFVELNQLDENKN